MNIGKIVTYGSIFGREAQVPKSADLLMGISSQVLIQYYSYINTMCFLNPVDPNIERYILKQILFRFDENERSALVIAIAKVILRSKGTPLKFFPLESILSCIQDELIRQDQSDPRPPTKEEELNILLSVLAKNDSLDKEAVSRLGKIRKRNDEDLRKLIWTISFPHSEFWISKNIFTATFKSIQFLEYLSTSKQLSPFHQDFAKSTSEYLKQLYLLFHNASIKQKWKLTSVFLKGGFTQDPSIRRITADLDKIKTISKNDLQDFKFLRKFPIIGLPDESYAITNWNFIIDKFYPAIVYDFFNGTNVKEAYKGKDDRDKFNAYMSQIGKEFGESILLKKIVHKMLRGQSRYTYLGDEKVRTYDLYCRIDRHVFLIEFKNIMLPKKKDYDEIKDTIDSRLIKSGNDKKGVLQLIDQVEKFRDDPEGFEPFKSMGINPNRLVIYPIIVYTDNSLNLHGINSYLNGTFRKEILGIKPKLTLSPLRKVEMERFN